MAERADVRTAELAARVEERLRVTAGVRGQHPMVGSLERCDAQPRQPALGKTEDIALAAQLEVGLGELEPVERPLATRLCRLVPVQSQTRSAGSETSTQYETAFPRPTRPRSWWS